MKRRDRRHLDPLQAGRPTPQQPQGDAHVVGVLPERRIGLADSEWLTAEEAALYCRFDATALDPVVAFRRWLGRKALPVRRRGRYLLINRRVLDAAMEV